MGYDMQEMMAKMYRYYRSQPSCLERIMGNRDQLVGSFGVFYADRDPDRVYLIGSGSSHNACNAARAFMQRILGLEVTVATPTAPASICAEHPLFIAVSQGGRSTNTHAYLTWLREQGYPVVTFTADLSSPLAKAADLAVDIGVGDETVGPKTVGFTGTVLVLYLAALEAGRAAGRLDAAAHGRELQALTQVIACAGENMDRCEAFFHRHLDALRTARHFLFVGKGPAAAVGEEAALKVLETLCYPAAGYEFEEYLHGPACCTGGETALFQFVAQGPDGARMERLSAITSGATANSYLIDRTGRFQGDKVLQLLGDGSHLSPFADIFLGQLLSARLTGILGRERHPAVWEIFHDMDTKLGTDASRETR